jgi:prepilin-type N-terminal cleavage/methylation domain-containing protein
MDPYMDKKFPPHVKGPGGFTIIEVIMVMVLVGIISATMAMVIYQGTRSFGQMDTRRNLSAKGRLAVERMIRELRLVRCSNSNPTSCTPDSTDITKMSSTDMRFVNINHEGRGLRLDGGDIKLRLGTDDADPEYVLIDEVSALNFEYLKSDGTTAVSAAEVWSVKGTLTLTAGDQSLNFRILAHPRSFL